MRVIRLISSCPERLRSLKTWLDIARGNLPQQPEQIIVLADLQRSHSTSPTPWFCDLKYPSFYLNKLGLPFLVQIHASLWIFAQQLLTALETAGGFAGDCAKVWQKLIWQGAQLPARPIFSQDAHQGSIQFPMRGYSTGGMPSSCVDPGEMTLSTQTSSHYVPEVLELPFIIQSLFTTCILLPPFSKPSVVPGFPEVLCTRVNPTYFSFFLSVSLSVVEVLKSSGCFRLIWRMQYGLLTDTCIYPVFMSYSFHQNLWDQIFSFS